MGGHCPVNEPCQKRDLKFEFRKKHGKKHICVAVELLPDLVLKLSTVFCVLINLHLEECVNDDMVLVVKTFCIVREKTTASCCFRAGWFWDFYTVN